MDLQTLMGRDAQPTVETTLAHWIADHGPLWPEVALVVALRACAQASRMTDVELAAVIGSLDANRIVRASTGVWQWKPTRSESSFAGMTDADVIERLGALLFHALTGRTAGDVPAGEAAIQTGLRNQRPDLTAAVADLTVRALSTRQSRPWPLDTFARDVSRVLSGAPSTEPPRRRTLAIGTIAALLVFGIGTWLNARGTEHLESHGLTTSETVMVDVVQERAQGFAMMDEHTAAIQEYQEIARWWSGRVPPDDPRLAWNTAHEAWVRTLRGDRLTTEQQLGSVEGAPTGVGNVVGATARLAATLGDRHPYTRAARLELAATLKARGANADAIRLQELAENGARELLGDASVLLGGIPTPPGVIAHVAPNAPQLEGFRRVAPGTYYTVLTSEQRLLSSRDGWRLHLIANGACRASVVIGNNPRLLTMNVARNGERRWQVRFEGTTPPITADAIGERLHLSLLAETTDALEIRLADRAGLRVKMDETTRVPPPPYTLSFASVADGGGCALVWLEIPFPFEPKS